MSTLATNANETSLTINGVIDARDFIYISQTLTKLTTLNLQRATIAAYASDKPLIANQYTYAANVIPVMALASHPTLKNLTLPTSATAIGTGALAGCKALTTVTMQQGLENIEAYAFAGCTSLSNVTIPASVSRLGDGAFTRCTALSGITLGDGIGAKTFTIGDEAFLGCTQLSKFEFNNKLAHIGHRAFAGTKIKALDLTAYNQLSTIGDYAFAKAPLTTVKYPSSVTTIGTGALLYSSASSVLLPSMLQKVPDFAFAGASALQQIELVGTKIDTIGDYALYRANKVEQLTIPATTMHIGTQAMAGMTALTEINTRAAIVPTLGDEVWKGLNQSSITLYAPSSAIAGYKAADQWKEFNIMPGFMPGDVNNNKIVDVDDINATINYILNKPNSGVFIFDAADLDGNSMIDVNDINLIINIILGIAYAPAQPNTGDYISIDDFSINAGEQRTIEVKLNASAEYSALQCDLIMPAGLNVTKAETASSTGNHTLVMGENNDRVRLLCFSYQGKTIDSNTDAESVIRLTVEANSDIASLSTIGIENAILSTPDSQTMNCANTTTWVSTTTGVNDLADINVKVWSQGNVLIIESNEPAIAQLVAMNGISTQLAVMGGRNEFTDIAPGIYVVRVGSKSFKVII